MMDFSKDEFLKDRDIVVVMEFGSHLYGLNTPSSDKDYKGIYLPTKKELLMGETKTHYSYSTGDNDSKNGADDVDVEFYSLHYFLELARKGETVAMDMLHAPKDKLMETSGVWKWLQKNRSDLYTKNMKSYVGYVKTQAAKYGIRGSRMGALEEVMKVVIDLPVLEKVKVSDLVFTDRLTVVGDFMNSLPVNEHARFVSKETSQGIQMFYEVLGRKFQLTLKVKEFKDNLKKIWDTYGERARMAKDNDGIDWKAVSHALRAGFQARAIYTEGEFSYPLKETDYLLDVKEGKRDFLNDVQPTLEALVEQVMELADNSGYPKKANMDKFWWKMREAHANVFVYG